MKKILSFLKKIWFLNYIKRVYNASKYFNKKYWQILKWGFNSKEESNFTYRLSTENIQYLANTISVVTGIKYTIILEYFNEAETDEFLKETIVTAIKNSPYKRFADKEVAFGRRLG